MGNLFSSQSLNRNEYQPINYNNDIQRLKQRLESLEGLDRNTDGNVSKDELNSWKKQQREELKTFKVLIQKQTEQVYADKLIEHERELQNVSNKLRESDKENMALKNIIKSLEDKLEHYNAGPSIHIDGQCQDHLIKEQMFELSRKRINLFVEQLLDNKNVNIRYLPDAVERQIYRNVITILIGIMDDVISTTSIRFMGQQIVLDLKPIVDTPEIDKKDKDKNNNKKSHEKNHKKKYSSIKKKEKKRKSMSHLNPESDH